MLLGGTALAAASIASVPFTLRAHSGRTDADVVAWLRAAALPLATAEPGQQLR